MVKRVAASVLWLFAVAWAFNFISAYTGLAQPVGGLVAIATALFVGLDPMHRMWPVSASSVHDMAPVASRVPSRI